MSGSALRINKLLLAASLLGAAACDKQAPGPSLQPPTEYQSASGEISSWGMPVRRWRVDHDGRAEIITNGFLGEGKEATVIFTLDLDQKARLRSLFQAAAAFKGHRVECKGASSDPPYGNVRLETPTGSDVIYFIADCPSAGMKRVEASEQAIYDYLVKASAGGTQVTRTIKRGRAR
jgi:hypothetical protein